MNRILCVCFQYKICPFVLDFYSSKVGSWTVYVDAHSTIHIRMPLRDCALSFIPTALPSTALCGTYTTLQPLAAHCSTLQHQLLQHITGLNWLLLYYLRALPYLVHGTYGLTSHPEDEAFIYYSKEVKGQRKCFDHFCKYVFTCVNIFFFWGGGVHDFFSSG